MKDNTIYLLYNINATEVKVENRPKTVPGRDEQNQSFQEYIGKDEFTIRYGDDDNRESTDIKIVSKTRLRDRPKSAGALNKRPNATIEGVFVRRSNSLSKIEDFIQLRRCPTIKPLLSETEIIRLQKFQDECKQTEFQLKSQQDLKEAGIEPGRPSGVYGGIKDLYSKNNGENGKIPTHHEMPSHPSKNQVLTAPQKTQGQNLEKSPRTNEGKGLKTQSMGTKKADGVIEKIKNKAKEIGVRENSKKITATSKKENVRPEVKDNESPLKRKRKTSAKNGKTGKQKNKNKPRNVEPFSDIGESKTKLRSKTAASETSKTGPKSNHNFEGKGEKSRTIVKDEGSSKRKISKSGDIDKPGGKKSEKSDKPNAQRSTSGKNFRVGDTQVSKQNEMLLKHGDKGKPNQDMTGEKHKKGKKSISDTISRKSETKDLSDGNKKGKQSSSDTFSRKRGKRDSSDENNKGKQSISDTISWKSEKRNQAKDNKKGKISFSDGFVKTSVSDDRQSQSKSRSFKKLPTNKTSDKSGMSSQSQSKETSSKTKKDSRKKSSKFSSLMQNMIRYVLSNQVFLKMGWSLQPSDRTMSRVVTFKTRPANPALYCFRENDEEEIKFYSSGQLALKIKTDGTGGMFYPGGSPAMAITKGISGTRLTLFSDCTKDPLIKESFLAKVIGIFDCYGNGVLYDPLGEKILNFNQLEGIFHNQAKPAVYKWRWNAYETLHKQCAKELLRSAVIDSAQSAEKKTTTTTSGKSIVGRKSTLSDRKVSSERKSDVEKVYEKLLSELPRPLESKPRVRSESRIQSFKPIIFKINDEMTLRINGQNDVTINFSSNKFKYRIDLGVIVDPEKVEKIEELRSDQSESIDCVFNALKTLSPSLQELNKQIQSQSQSSKERFMYKKVHYNG